MIEHVTVGLAGPQLISIYEVQQRHGLAPQRMDHVPIIDHMTVLAVAAGSTPYEREHARAADEQLHAIIKQARARTVADQPRGHRIKYLSQNEAARGTHVDQLLLVIGCAVVGQWLQHGTLGINAL